MTKQLKMDKKIHYLTAHPVRSALIAASLCLIPQTFCLAAAPQEFKFNVKHFSVEGLPPFPQTIIADYSKPLQNKPYTLKELQEVSKTLELLIRKQGHPFYQVTVPAQSLDSGEIKLQVVMVKALNCKTSKP